MTIARDGIREIAISTATLGVGAAAATWAAVAGSPWWWCAAVPLAVLWVFTVAFFRDPRRVIPTGPGLLVSAADGRVTEVTRLDEYDGIDGPALRIGIFLSIFNVHVNRAPCGGRVVRTHYQPGEFLDARHPESGVRNESMTVVLEPEAGMPGPLVVRQVAGFLARRIVCRLKANSRVKRGERFGLIKFGSRTELIVPDVEGLKPAVQVGDVVKGGSTVLVRFDAPQLAPTGGESPQASASEAVDPADGTGSELR
ncbi:MAG: phosphatidylserine decarboxylase [Planctomycetota bacterium]|nr:phosphatidylserine decarboxylase [Planctomycetota bacterium]